MGLKIRRLTPNEYFRLMGVKDKDFNNVAPNQSNSSLYHLAGDSIVTTPLMAIFGELLGLDYETIIHDLVEDLKECA
jgi:site-specific DNA-cytosine methylase